MSLDSGKGPGCCRPPPPPPPLLLLEMKSSNRRGGDVCPAVRAAARAAAAALCLWNDGDFTHVCTACFARETFFHAEKTIERVAKLHNQGTEIWDCAQWAGSAAKPLAYQTFTTVYLDTPPRSPRISRLKSQIMKPTFLS